MKHFFSVLACWLCISTAFSQRLPDLIPYRKGNWWGYCDSAKKMVIEPRYKAADLFSDGLAKVRINDSLEGFISTEGKLLFTFSFRDTFIDDFYNGRARMSKLDRSLGQQQQTLLGFINKKFKIVIPLETYAEGEYSDFKYGYAFISHQQLIDTLGRVVFHSRKMIEDATFLTKDLMLIEFSGPGEEYGIVDLVKEKIILLSKYNSEEWGPGDEEKFYKRKLRLLDYPVEKINSIQPNYLDSRPLKVIYRDGGFTYIMDSIDGYMDKYGTEYWED